MSDSKTVSPYPGTIAVRILIVAEEGNHVEGKAIEMLPDGRNGVGSPTSGIHLMACWVHTYSDWKTRLSPTVGVRQLSLCRLYVSVLVEVSRCRLPPASARAQRVCVQVAEFFFMHRFIDLPHPVVT